MLGREQKVVRKYEIYYIEYVIDLGKLGFIFNQDKEIKGEAQRIGNI